MLQKKQFPLVNEVFFCYAIAFELSDARCTSPVWCDCCAADEAKNGFKCCSDE